MKALPTWGQFCKQTGRNPKKLPGVSAHPRTHQKHATADFKLIQLADHVRGKWRPDWTDYSQDKYYPVFTVRKTKFGRLELVFDLAPYWYAHVLVGSRLCFPTREMAVSFGKKYLKLYQDYHLYT